MYNFSNGDLFNLQNIDFGLKNTNVYLTNYALTNSLASNPRVFIDSFDWNNHISDVSIDSLICSFSLDVVHQHYRILHEIIDSTMQNNNLRNFIECSSLTMTPFNATNNLFSEPHPRIVQGNWADILVYDSVFVNHKHPQMLIHQQLILHQTVSINMIFQRLYLNHT